MKFQSMLILQKRYCLIDSPIPFQLVCNPFGTFNSYDENRQFIGDLTDINGTDICSRPAGAWQFDIYHLLPEKWMKENPAFKVAICYDDTALSAGQSVSIGYSDVNLGEGVAGVNGQTVQDIELTEKVNELKTIVDNIQSILESQNPSHTLELVGTYNTITDFFNIYSSVPDDDWFTKYKTGDIFFIPLMQFYKNINPSFGVVTLKDIYLCYERSNVRFEILDCKVSFSSNQTIKQIRNGYFSVMPDGANSAFKIYTNDDTLSTMDLRSFNSPSFFRPVRFYQVLD